MDQYILSVNAGSSSLKLSLFSQTGDGNNPLDHLLTASVASISAHATFSVKCNIPNVLTMKEQLDNVHDHSRAFERFLKFLDSRRVDKTKIKWICHRVVHGGRFNGPVVVDEESMTQIAQLSDLAPLHNGPALSVIHLCSSSLPGAVSIAYFDTTFHRSIPPHISTYPIDQTIAQERGLCKYGFHGISYAYIIRQISAHLNKSIPSLSLILLHLGSGASACAIRHGKSYDTSMGLTPVSGLPGATRSGTIDPSLIFHYTNKAGKITHDPSMAVDIQVTLVRPGSTI
jgi:acetate kinase